LIVRLKNMGKGFFPPFLEHQQVCDRKHLPDYSELLALLEPV
jgi:hypothetical protein